MFELRLWKKRTKEINANRKTTSGKARANDQPSNIAHKHSPKGKKVWKQSECKSFSKWKQNTMKRTAKIEQQQWKQQSNIDKTFFRSFSLFFSTFFYPTYSLFLLFFSHFFSSFAFATISCTERNPFTWT